MATQKQNLIQNIEETIQEIKLYISFAQNLVNESGKLLNTRVEKKTLDSHIEECKLIHQYLAELNTNIANYLLSAEDFEINKELIAEANKSQVSLNRMSTNLEAHLRSITALKKRTTNSSGIPRPTQSEVKRPVLIQPVVPQSSWSCQTCTFINSNDIACEMCGTSRPTPPSEAKQPQSVLRLTQPAPERKQPQSVLRLTHAKAEQQNWDCPVCTYKNSQGHRICEMCQTKKPSQTTQPAPDHKQSQTKIIRINPQRFDSICTPASFIIAMLILQDINLLDNVKLVNILHDMEFNLAYIVRNMISEIKNGDPAYNIGNLNARITQLSTTSPFNNMEILCESDGSAGGVDCEGKNHNAIFKQIFVGLLTNMPVNSVMSFIYAGTGCAFVRISDKYVYIDTHGHASEDKNGSKGYIISAPNVLELLNNMDQIISMCVDKYKAVFATNIEDIHRHTVRERRLELLLARNIMQQYSYCIYKFKQPGQRGGYIAKKQDWFKIKYM